MSFGCGIGDIATITKLALDLYRACKTSAKEFQRISADVSNLRVILEDLAEDLRKDGVKLSQRREERLRILLTNAYNALHDLQQELLKYDSLSTIRQKKYDAVRFGFKEVSDIRLRIVSTITGLNAVEAILNRLENTALRKQLVKYFKEVKAAREGDEYAGSILANTTCETIRTIETWRELGPELEQIGIDKTVLHEKQEYIAEVIQDAIEAGDIDGTDMDIANLPPRKSIVSLGGTSTLVGSDPVAEAEAAEALLSRWDTDATLIDSEYAAKHARLAAAGEVDADQMADELLALHSKGGRGASKKHGRVAALALRLFGLVTDERLLEACDEGDVRAVVELIRGGADVRATDKWQWTPLHMAAYGGFDKIARLLVLHGADMAARTVDGETPLLLAEKNGNDGVVRVIEEEFERKEREMDGVVAAAAAAAATQAKETGRGAGRGKRRIELRESSKKEKSVVDQKKPVASVTVREKKIGDDLSG